MRAMADSGQKGSPTGTGNDGNQFRFSLESNIEHSGRNQMHVKSHKGNINSYTKENEFLKAS
jgi:hypothetical protein